MNYVKGDILKIFSVDGRRVVARCFTSNGEVKKNRELVMGAGVAKAFRDHFPGLALEAGAKVNFNGNCTQCIGKFNGLDNIESLVVAFPTKHMWREDSDLKLIIQSATELVELIELRNWQKHPILLPRPGTLNGGLPWKLVKEHIEDILPDNVYIVIPPPELLENQ